MTVFRAATLRTFFLAMHAGARVKNKPQIFYSIFSELGILPML